MSRPFGLAALLAVLVLAACQGAAPAASSGSSARASSAPSTAPSAAGSPSAGGSAPASLGPLPSLDVAGAAAALEGVDSYRISIATGETLIEGTIIRQPDQARDMTFTVGDTTQRIIVIGDQAWLDGGGGTFAEVPVAFVGALTAAADPIVLMTGFTNPAFRGALTRVGDETKNGVPAAHLHADASTVGALASFPPGATVDLWISPAGYLVAMESSGFDDEVPSSIQITNINDPANKVEPPG